MNSQRCVAAHANWMGCGCAGKREPRDTCAERRSRSRSECAASEREGLSRVSAFGQWTTLELGALRPVLTCASGVGQLRGAQPRRPIVPSLAQTAARLAGDPRCARAFRPWRAIREPPAPPPSSPLSAPSRESARHHDGVLRARSWRRHLAAGRRAASPLPLALHRRPGAARRASGGGRGSQAAAGAGEAAAGGAVHDGGGAPGVGRVREGGGGGVWLRVALCSPSLSREAMPEILGRGHDPRKPELPTTSINGFLAKVRAERRSHLPSPSCALPCPGGLPGPPWPTPVNRCPLQIPPRDTLSEESASDSAAGMATAMLFGAAEASLDEARCDIRVSGLADIIWGWGWSTRWLSSAAAACAHARR